MRAEGVELGGEAFSDTAEARDEDAGVPDGDRHGFQGEKQRAFGGERGVLHGESGILQEIIINQQKIVSAIIDDMNFLAEKLEKAIAEGKKVAEDYAAVKRMLMQLRKQIEIELNKK